MALASPCSVAGAACSFSVDRDVPTAMYLPGTGNIWGLKLNTFAPEHFLLCGFFSRSVSAMAWSFWDQ